MKYSSYLRPIRPWSIVFIIVPSSRNFVCFWEAWAAFLDMFKPPPAQTITFHCQFGSIFLFSIHTADCMLLPNAIFNYILIVICFSFKLDFPFCVPPVQLKLASKQKPMSDQLSSVQLSQPAAPFSPPFWNKLEKSQTQTDKQTEERKVWAKKYLSGHNTVVD